MSDFSSRTVAAAEAAVRPTSVRWRIIAMIVVISMVTYLDRLNISIAAPHMMREFGLSAVQMGRIFSAFVFAYGLFQLPGGWLGDRFGPRIVLAAAIGWWSLFTAMTAVTTEVPLIRLLPVALALVFVRFCMGIGEAAAFPNFNRTIANWTAPGERTFAASLPLAGGGLGATITPPIIAVLILKYGWREAFFVCAGLGFVISAIWFWYARDSPHQHPRVNQAERELIHGGSQPADTARTRPKTPWRSILGSANVWLLTGINFTCGYITYIYLTWFFTYLTQTRGLTTLKGSYYTMGPFIAITLMTPLGGLVCDAAVRRYGKRKGRLLVGMGGMIVAGAMLLIGARIANINVAILMLSLGAGSIFVSFAAQWVVTIDICKRHAGVVSGLMNWGGNTGGTISPMLTPFIAEKIGWSQALQCSALLLIIGGVAWLFVRPDRPILNDE